VRKKIALEEHFVIPETLAASYGAPGSREFQRQLQDIGSARIAEMDRGGLDVCILSLVGDGVQAIPNVSEAIRISRRANDHLAEQIAKHPKRFKGFAALPLQDPQIAAQELTRCIRELGFCGALVNGYSQINTPDSIVFYDLPQYRDFWATVQQLDGEQEENAGNGPHAGTDEAPPVAASAAAYTVHPISRRRNGCDITLKIAEHYAPKLK
jgi:2,3-dihydroxybenzoate decarboxylase